MSEDTRDEVVQELLHLHYLTDSVLYANYTPESLKKRLTEIETLIDKVQAT